MDEILGDIRGTLCFNNILVSGAGREQHDQRLGLVMNRLAMYGVLLPHVNLTLIKTCICHNAMTMNSCPEFSISLI